MGYNDIYDDDWLKKYQSVNTGTLRQMVNQATSEMANHKVEPIRAEVAEYINNEIFDCAIKFQVMESLNKICLTKNVNGSIKNLTDKLTRLSTVAEKIDVYQENLKRFLTKRADIDHFVSSENIEKKKKLHEEKVRVLDPQIKAIDSLLQK